MKRRTKKVIDRDGGVRLPVKCTYVVFVFNDVLFLVVVFLNDVISCL